MSRLTSRIAVATIAARLRRSICVPNFTPASWFECDLYEIAANGTWNEYEVKLSVADFSRDRLKVVRYELVNGEVMNQERKHDLIAAGRGPSRFWFVAPFGLLSSVPPWSGLIEMLMGSGGYRPHVKRPAPVLNGNLVSALERTAALTAAHGRLWSELRAVR